MSLTTSNRHSGMVMALACTRHPVHGAGELWRGASVRILKCMEDPYGNDSKTAEKWKIPNTNSGWRSWLKKSFHRFCRRLANPTVHTYESEDLVVTTKVSHPLIVNDSLQTGDFQKIEAADQIIK